MSFSCGVAAAHSVTRGFGFSSTFCLENKSHYRTWSTARTKAKMLTVWFQDEADDAATMPDELPCASSVITEVNKKSYRVV